MFKPGAHVNRSAGASQQRRPTSTDRLTLIAFVLGALAMVLAISHVLAPSARPDQPVAVIDAGR